MFAQPRATMHDPVADGFWERRLVVCEQLADAADCVAGIRQRAPVVQQSGAVCICCVERSGPAAQPFGFPGQQAPESGAVDSVETEFQ
jgi:hypothetical protein